MQNKQVSSLNRKPDMLKGCLIMLLLTPPGFAQQSDPAQSTANATPMAAPVISTTDSESSIKKKNQLKPESKRPPSPQFTPTEKIHADDAVAFPVDI